MLNPDSIQVQSFFTFEGPPIINPPKVKLDRKLYALICANCGKSFEKVLMVRDYAEDKKFYCCRSCANRRNHSEETKKKISDSTYKYLKRIGHVTPEPKYCSLCGRKISRSAKNLFCIRCLWKPEDRRKFLASRIKGSGAGGYRENAPKGHQGKYKGIHCDSSWELVYLIYQLDHNVNIARNKEGFKYIYKNEIHTYYPDFKIDDTYIEIKGREYPNWKYKLAQFPKDKKLIVLHYKEMKKYIEYVKGKYGSNFISLYDDKQKEIDYLEPHWYTNVFTKAHLYCVGKLTHPFVLGRL